MQSTRQKQSYDVYGRWTPTLFKRGSSSEEDEPPLDPEVAAALTVATYDPPEVAHSPPLGSSPV